MTFPVTGVLFDCYTFNDIVRGTIPGLSVFLGGAESTTISGDFETVWGFPVSAVRNVAAEGVTIASSSSDDAVGDIGAHSVLISYLNPDGVLATELINLNGTVPVTSTATDILRVARAEVTMAGALDANAGDITILGATTTNSMGTIPSDRGITGDAFFTLPEGFEAILIGFTATAPGASQPVDIRVRTGRIGCPLIERRRFSMNELTTYFDSGIAIVAHQDVLIEARVGAGMTTVRIDPVILVIEIDKFRSTE